VPAALGSGGGCDRAADRPPGPHAPVAPAHPAYAPADAALLVGICGVGALHPTAVATRPGSVATPGDDPVPSRRRRSDDPAASRRSRHDGQVPSRRPAPHEPRPARMPPTLASRSVHPLRAALALQGAMFGACQSGTALAERLGPSDQAGLVYAAVGVMSAVAGLSMAAVPARVAHDPLADGDRGRVPALPAPPPDGQPGCPVRRRHRPGRRLRPASDHRLRAHRARRTAHTARRGDDVRDECDRRRAGPRRLAESYGPVALTARAKSYGGPATETTLHARGPDQQT